MEPPWDGGTKVCSNDPGHKTNMAAMLIYGKSLKNLLLWNQKADNLEPGAVAPLDAWYADNCGFDSHIQQHSFMEFGHEITSTAISPFRWFKKGSCQLLAKEQVLNTGKLPRRLALEQCV